MEQPGSRRPVHLNRMRGRPVIDANGDNVGTIEDVVADPGSWHISGFVVSLRRDVAERLDIERGGFLDAPRLEVGAERVRTVGDNVLLNIDVDAIAQTLRQRPGEAPSVVPEDRFGAERFEPERPEPPLYDPLREQGHDPRGGPPGF